MKNEHSSSHTTHSAPEIHRPIGESPAHLTLISFAAKHGIEAMAVRSLLFGIRAPRTLPLFPLICFRIEQILLAAVLTWKVSLQDWNMQHWPEVARFVVRERNQLRLSMGPEFSKPISQDASDPFWGYLTHWAPYPSFGLNHATSDEHYLLLQAQLLFAYANDARKRTTLEQYESCTKLYFDRPQRDPRAASYAVRQLSRESIEIEKTLRALPVVSHPAEFAGQMRYVRVPDHPWFIRLRDDLRNYVQLAHGQRDPREGSGGGGGGGGTAVRGHMSYNDEWWTVAHVEADEDDPFAAKTGLELIAQSSIDPEERRKMVEEGACAAEFGSENELIVEVSDANAHRDPSGYTGALYGAIHHLEMANQLFWFAYDVLTPHEAALIVREAYTVLRSHPKPTTQRDLLRLEVATLAIVMIATSAPLSQALSLHVVRSDGANHDVDLCLVLDCEGLAARWRLRAPVPDCRIDESPVPTVDDEHTPFVTQPDLAHSGLFVRRLLRALSLGQAAREGVQIFRRKPETYRKALRRWLEEIDESKRTTINKLPKFLFAHLVRTADGDAADACFATAYWHALAQVPAHYSTPTLARLQQLYTDTFAQVRTAIAAALRNARSDAQELAMPNAPAPRSQCRSAHMIGTELRIANRPTATRAAVQQMTSWLCREIRRESRISCEVASPHGHNMYTLYSLQFLAAALGLRFPSPGMFSCEDIDLETGAAVLREKTVRLSWLVDEAMEQLRNYREYSARWAPSPIRTSDGPLPSGFFVTRSMHEVPISPSSCSALLGDRFPFPSNIFRRFMRNALREADCGCPFEVCEAWLGHRPCGREQYHIYSTFNYGAYRQSLRTFLAPILKDVGFRAHKWKEFSITQ